MHPNITGVVAIDAKTIRQLELSHLTWHKFHPEMREWPWLVVYDCEQITADTAQQVADTLSRKDGLTLRWPLDGRQYETQREKMLTAFVSAVPFAVETQFWMKLDCDSICVRPCENWIDLDWFTADAHGHYNAWIASSWPYTKAKGGGGTLIDWCNSMELVGDRIYGRNTRLDLLSRLSSTKTKLLHPRMASWFSFYCTQWTRDIATMTAAAYRPHYLPVPSQDTWMWYCAERGRYRRLAVRMLGKRRGWTNVPRYETLSLRVKGLMQA